jgi:hypothetical protein
MKLKNKLLKVLLVFVLASVAVNLIVNYADFRSCEIGDNTWACNPDAYNNPPQVWNSLVTDSLKSVPNQTNNLLGYLFQLMFILFFISPPLIVVMLFLIWQELKKRNEMK